VRGASASATTVEAQHPRYIVVFQRPSERNLGITSRVLKVGEEKGASARAGMTVFRARAAGGPRPRLYEQLGVAVTDLDESELRQMQAEEQVAAVVPNELRFVPNPPPPEAAPDLAAAFAPSLPLALGDDPLVAYLQGMRDAAAAALRYRQATLGQGPAAALPALVAGAPSAGLSWCLDMVNVTAASRFTGRGVSVAVLDTGIDLQHPDLAGRVVEGDTAQSFVPNETVQDGHGHGTHCAGVVTGPVQSASGTRYGVAPDATLLVGKVLSNAGSGFDDGILDGMAWAAEHGARVLSMSLGSRRNAGQPFSVAYERVAQNLLESGVLVVAAAGNGSSRPFFTRPVENPAACPSILAVAAVDRARRVAPFSCRKMDDVGEVNVSAPGVSVLSAWTGGGFRSISGTSMATPHVAGVAALCLESRPELTARELWRALESAAQALGDPNDFGEGLVQAP
jgi:subtilisin family serine protease